MKYNYEFLRKCHGLRFKAVKERTPIEGVINVEKDEVVLCYGEETLDNFDCFHRSYSVVILPDDSIDELSIFGFEVVPRDPETYKDWQVGDKIIMDEKVRSVIFRCGEVVLYKYSNDKCCTYPYTCKELYDKGYRLVLTGIEEQIIEGEKMYEPQDGDICFIKARAPHVVIFKDNKYNVIETYADFRIDNQYLYDFIFDACLIADIKECRLATEQEKQMLFDTLAKAGKRWNAEKKCMEDVPKPYEFKKGEPVLVKDEGGKWRIGVFIQRENSCYGYRTRPADGIGEIGYRYCIPYNEETMHLLGTTEDYKEGER